MLRVSILCALFLIRSSAQARIGETPIQFADRYGAPIDSQLTKIVDKSSPLVEGAIHHTYAYQGWKIRAAFCNSTDRRCEWTSRNSPLQAFLP